MGINTSLFRIVINPIKPAIKHSLSVLKFRLESYIILIMSVFRFKIGFI